MIRPAFFSLAIPLFGCGLFDSGGNSREGRFVARTPPGLVARTSYDLEILDYESKRSVATTISSARSSDESVAVASALEGGVVRFEVEKAGAFSLDFTGQADGEDIVDAFDLRAIEAERLELAHLCDATYVANRPADVELWFSDATRARGNGYGWYPVVVENATLDADASTAHTLRVELGDTSATITSSLAPSNEAPAQLALDVVPISRIDGLQILDESNSRVLNGRRIEKDQELAIRVVPGLGERPLCGALVPARVTASESSDCMLATANGSGDLQRSLATNGEAIIVVAVAYGVCQLTAELIDEGLTEVLDLDLSEPPRSSGSSDFD